MSENEQRSSVTVILSKCSRNIDYLLDEAFTVYLADYNDIKSIFVRLTQNYIMLCSLQIVSYC